MESVSVASLVMAEHQFLIVRFDPPAQLGESNERFEAGLCGQGGEPVLARFRLIALPLSIDGVVVTAINVFAFGWNEALFSSAFTSRDAQTVATFILASRGTRDIDFNLAAVNTLIAIGPPVILSFFFQRSLARGLSFGAVKG